MPSTSTPTIKIDICTPTYNGHVTTEYTKSLLSLQKKLADKGIEFNIIFDQSSLLHFSRNLMASRCLSTPDVTHVLFIDSDIGFDASTVMKLIDANLEIIGAVYPWKLLPLRYPLGQVSETEALEEWISRHLGYAVRGSARKYTDEIYEFDGIGTGLLLISKSALRKMIRDGRVENFKVDSRPYWYSSDNYYGFFDYMTIDGHSVGEDYAFCERWRSTGGKIYGLVSEIIMHVGTNTVKGRYSEYNSVCDPSSESISGQDGELATGSPPDELP